MKKYVEIKNVSKSFQDIKVIDNINVSFEKGKIHGIVGRNGSGKTVLIKMMCGFIKPDIGSITINNKIIGKDVDFPESVGAIIETPSFLPHLSAYKNLSYLAALKGKIGKEEINNAIEKVGLDYNNKKTVGKYSLGMRQRLGLAQSIMENPDLLILDEPMNSLDENGVNDIRNILIDLKNEGKTIIIVSHNAEDIDVLCDDVYEMKNGTLHRSDKIKNGKK